MKITNVVCPESKYSIKCPYEMKPEGICVHNTANDASAMSEVSYMLGNSNKTSFHVAVDNERIVTAIPFNRNAWHSGDGKFGKGNRTQIAIEICYSKSGGEKFEKSEELASSYIAYLLKQYDWGIDKVSKHQDYSNKYCPHRTLDIGWERFLNKIQYHMEEKNKTDETNNEVLDNNKEEKPMYKFRNGKTVEPIYADCKHTVKIGNLNIGEVCDCYGIFNGAPIVRYQIDGSNNYKIGFAVDIRCVKNN